MQDGVIGCCCHHANGHPLCFCIARLRNRVTGCGKLRTNLKRARRRTVLQPGMYNIQTSGTYTNACNGAKLRSSVLSLPDGPHPTHSHPWKKTKRGDLGKEVDMLSLNTASRTCRLGLKLHGPKFARLQLSLKIHFCPSTLKYAARLSHARTWEGNSHVRMCVHRIKAAATNHEQDFSVR